MLMLSVQTFLRLRFKLVLKSKSRCRSVVEGVSSSMDVPPSCHQAVKQEACGSIICARQKEPSGQSSQVELTHR